MCSGCTDPSSEASPRSASRAFDRRDFLKLSGAGLLGVVLLGSGGLGKVFAQAGPSPERGQGLPAIHAGTGAVRALAERQPRLLGASAGGLQGCRGVDQRSEDRDLHSFTASRLITG